MILILKHLKYKLQEMIITLTSNVPVFLKRVPFNIAQTACDF